MLKNVYLFRINTQDRNEIYAGDRKEIFADNRDEHGRKMDGSPSEAPLDICDGHSKPDHLLPLGLQ